MRTKRILKSTFLYILAVAILSFLPLSHKTYAAKDLQYVYDNAGILTTDERSKLEKSCETYSNKNDADIIVITVDSLSNQSRKEFLEDFYDSYVYGNGTHNGKSALLLLNMDPSSRGVEIQGYGPENDNRTPRYYLNSERIDVILDKIVPLLSDGNYYDAMDIFAKQTAHYIGYEYEIYYRLWFQILVSLFIGAVVVGIMAYQSGGRVTINDNTYLDQNTSRVLASRDDYIRTSITRVKKQQDNNGKNSGGGSSSGGHSHSGGGRSF